MGAKQPFFVLPRLGAWRQEIRSSDWAYWGFTYAGIFGAFTTVGLIASKIIGPDELAEQRRQNKRPMRVWDLNNTAWGVNMTTSPGEPKEVEKR